MEAFRKADQMDDQNQHVLLGLAQCHLGKREYEEAADFSLQSIAKTFHYPMAHYVLGLALTKMGRIEKAVDAFQNAVNQNPNFS